MKKIAIFHHTVGPDSAIGKILAQLARCLVKSGYKVTIFGQYRTNFKNPQLRLVKVPVIKRPLFLLFLTYHIASLIAYWWQRHVRGEYYDFKIGIESNFLFPDICYPHFCHRHYLKKEWKEVSGQIVWWLRILRWINYSLRALLEPFVFKIARWIIVPSEGLKNEIVKEYPWTSDKIFVIPNFIDWDAMQMPNDFEREGFRLALGLNKSDIVGTFVALGAFEHKGLHLVLQALADADVPVKLIVVGGQEHEIRSWRSRVESLGIEHKVVFVGFQADIRPYLWAADVFIFPSAKEIFPLAALEAAAAGLPLIVTNLYGVEEFMRDKELGYVVDRDWKSIKESLLKFSRLPTVKRLEMGRKAREATMRYTPDSFCRRWVKFLESKISSDERN